MIFNRCIFLVCIFPVAAFSATQPCGLSEFEQAGKGWLSAKTPGVLKYVVARKHFESSSMPKSWSVSLRAREAAHKGFSEYFKKISPPPVDASVFSVKGMQAKEMECIDGPYIFYEVSVSNLAWESSTVSVSQPKEDKGMFIDIPTGKDPQLHMTSPEQSLSVPKVQIED